MRSLIARVGCQEWVVGDTSLPNGGRRPGSAANCSSGQITSNAERIGLLLVLPTYAKNYVIDNRCVRASGLRAS